MLVSPERDFFTVIINLSILLVVLVQNCFLLQANFKSKTVFLGFTVSACFPHSSISHGQDFCACFPTFHLRYHEFFHTAILEISSAAHLTSLIRSFPESLHLIISLCSSKPPGKCFSPKVPSALAEVWGHMCWHNVGRPSSSSGVMEAPASLGQEDSP